MNFLLGFFVILSSLFATPDSSGWVAVERVQKNSFEHTGDEDDPSIWVIFSKHLGKEKFTVRFPEDPEYSHPSPDEMEMAASKDGESYRLSVLEGSLDKLEGRAKEIALQPEILLVEATRASAGTLDFLYQSEGKWVREHLHLTPHHLYVFQTKSDALQGDGHRYFTQSLDILK